MSKEKELSDKELDLELYKIAEKEYDNMSDKEFELLVQQEDDIEDIKDNTYDNFKFIIWCKCRKCGEVQTTRVMLNEDLKEEEYVNE